MHYTATLPQRLHVGDSVRVEGPYGRYNFQGKTHRQIWIAGGIGITPFVARLKALATTHDGKRIDLFHSRSAYDQGVIDKLTADAHEANVRLHILWDERDGRLDVDRLIKAVPDWREAELWFCGPAHFGRTIREGLAAIGFPPHRFHQELFEMR